MSVGYLCVVVHSVGICGCMYKCEGVCVCGGPVHFSPEFVWLYRLLYYSTKGYTHLEMSEQCVH